MVYLLILEYSNSSVSNIFKNIPTKSEYLAIIITFLLTNKVI